MGNPALNGSRQGRKWPQGYRPLTVHSAQSWGRGRWPSSPMEAEMSYVINQWKLELILALIEATRPILEMVVKWLLGIG